MWFQIGSLIKFLNRLDWTRLEVAVNIFFACFWQEHKCLATPIVCICFKGLLFILTTSEHILWEVNCEILNLVSTW